MWAKTDIEREEKREESEETSQEFSAAPKGHFYHCRDNKSQLRQDTLLLGWGLCPFLGNRIRFFKSLENEFL